MRKLGSRGQKWLKCAHLLFACLWVGGAVGLTLMNFLLRADDIMELYGIQVAKRFVDDFVIIPGALGCLLTGLLYSLFTPWGWFKHRWITVKWVITVSGVLFGTFFLGPWLNSLGPMAAAEGLAALTNPRYVHHQRMLQLWGTLQAATILFALFISVLKPWKGRAPAGTP